MKVLNLQCSRQHSFEGWFGSEGDFQGQLKRGLIECPMCADNGIQKMPSAPHLNFGGHPVSRSDLLNSPSTAVALSKNQAMPGAPMETGKQETTGIAAQAAFLGALRQVVATTEDVGQRFADEARRMHYGEVEARSIRGQASVREAVDLLEEGIEVMPLPMLPVLKQTLQ